MSLEYAEMRIKEALKLTKGNQMKAQQQIIAWIYEDAKLLHALAKPHLSGIVAYNVERVASGRAAATKKPVPPAEENASAKKAAKPEQFGLEILKAAAGNPAIFGLEDLGVPQKRGAASQRHVDAIKAIAAKSKHTKKP
jgi:hypothetical protein